MLKENKNREIEKCREILNYPNLGYFEENAIKKYLESLYER